MKRNGQILLVDITLQAGGYAVNSTCEENIPLVLRIDWIKKNQFYGSTVHFE